MIKKSMNEKGLPKLAELRKKKGMSQEELGKLLGKTRLCIARWELGIYEPSISDLKKISSIFSVSIDELVNNQDSKKTI
jgi:transcriptional regulator with XRE-family HTH domain